MAERSPQVSVVIPTYNRGEALRENLDSVLAQEGADYEAIYIDDASTDDTAAVLADYEAAHAGRLRVVRREENRGPGPARNAGAGTARGAFLLFTDDDTVVPRHWVKGMLARHQAHACDVLCGGIGPYSLSTPVERYLHHRMQTRLGKKARRIAVAPTGNLLVPRALFEEVGGFCEEWLPAAEDWELCYRLRAAGASIYYDPAVAISHKYQPQWAPALARMRAMGEMGVRISGARYRSLTAYVGYSAVRFLASPVWALWRYPLDLYFVALRMEAAFCGARLRAYLRQRVRR